MATPLALPFSGAALREQRERAGYTRPGLSRRVRDTTESTVSPQHIARLEKGTSTPQPPTLRALADALNVSIDDLLHPKKPVVTS